ASTAVPPQPNRTDIDRHLFELFPPAFVHHWPDAWVEIAYTTPATGNLDNGRQFSVLKLEEAADFAEAQNRAGSNVYVGVALRHETTASKPKGRAARSHVLTASHAHTDFDGQGDDIRV